MYPHHDTWITGYILKNISLILSLPSNSMGDHLHKPDGSVYDVVALVAILLKWSEYIPSYCIIISCLCLLKILNILTSFFECSISDSIESSGIVLLFSVISSPLVLTLQTVYKLFLVCDFIFPPHVTWYIINFLK